jgi:hypothetical protein
VSTYSTGVAFAPIDPTLAPICVAPKPKRQKRTNNVFLDDRGFKDLSDDYDHMLHDVDGGPFLRKLRHPAPALDEDTIPAFHAPFVPAKHKDQMHKDLDLSHLDPNRGPGLRPTAARLFSLCACTSTFEPTSH